MRKLRLQISVLALTLSVIQAEAQPAYKLYIRGVDKDSATMVAETNIQTSFAKQSACLDYINKLPGLLQARGYVTASVDSVRFDSLFARIVLYIGTSYRWAELNMSKVDPDLLDVAGWGEKQFTGKTIDFKQVALMEERILNHLENTGYPFARIYLDSVSIDRDPQSGNSSTDLIRARLMVNKGPVYKIDSIRIYGNAKISNSFLQRYLEIPNGTIYSKQKLQDVNKKMQELLFVEEERPFNLSMLGTGSVLNMYLKQKRSSQVNGIFGFLPNNQQNSNKLLITADLNLLLRNFMGGGETIGLNFQALQVKSQRLNTILQIPYLFHSPLGLDFYFDFLRKDSSFVNINAQLGIQYVLNNNELGKLFVQSVGTIVNEGGIDGPLVIQTRRLPDVADVSSTNLGLDYEYNHTDYRLNPRKGTEISIITSFGKKKIKKNNQILALEDPSDPGFKFEKLYDTVKLKTYQFRARVTAVKYFQLGKRSTIKTALNAGTFQSGNIFRNELFQIGGYRLLRGFDEESQYLSSYAIGTAEYHLILDRNSYFYLLTDGGWGGDNRQGKHLNYGYISGGLGLAYELKAGILNIAWAIGKRSDTPFNFKQSKIHLGFVNYF